ncbi:histidinol-phosphatase [Rhodococcus sp. BP-349]|nr:histidinol-phosphatase [Rhodococcus sp. BP-363]MBY6543329.1 histidinol-phosphatase [Rhodococcus sp. BP-369]MBY6562559.1 histidinol-phosphatase [Rhodococcus sp. BP-370]MBY6576851.1 histidinol-phosphatase [Rhodococcus sp. BP-364]MBY6586152.1 histidinol-phosphatase [Rhodococcus sp. BP-358]MBY6590489.1 histidinol-phosphatase [Rhodococcus sp. BP-362]MBY6592978.1 histidinol-phosphatase [Rhodococcus sp. BP-359]MBY6599165.1 histidinol-phosphatase [Rhodococcus sp. BP-353]MBY6601655.1 histidinol-p
MHAPEVTGNDRRARTAVTSCAVTDLADDLALALRLADAADAITTARFLAVDLRIEDKPDLTPVSDADLAVETEIRRLLSDARPADSVLGEEFGGDAVLSGRQWVLDPIDGTKSFVRGVPIWATLIALLVDGVPVVGVVSAPALKRRWWAADGLGAHARFDDGDARALSVSSVGTTGSASLGFSSLSGWKDAGLREQFIDLTDEVWRIRGYGDFLSYCLVAEGSIDVAAEPEVSLWDLAPLDVLVREAGGRFTALDGAAGPHGGSAVASNSLLHDAVLERLTRRPYSTVDTELTDE